MKKQPARYFTELETAPGMTTCPYGGCLNAEPCDGSCRNAGVSPSRVPLSDEQIDRIYVEKISPGHFAGRHGVMRAIVRAVEEAHGIGVTGTPATMEYVRAYVEERTDWPGREKLLGDIAALTRGVKGTGGSDA